MALRPIVWLIPFLICGLVPATASAAVVGADAPIGDAAAPCEPVLRVTDPDHDPEPRRVGVLPYDPAVDLLETWVGHDGTNVTLGARLAAKPTKDMAKGYYYWFFIQLKDKANHTVLPLVVIQPSNLDSASVYDPGSRSLGEYAASWNESSVVILMPMSVLTDHFGADLTIGPPIANAEGPHPTVYGRALNGEYWYDQAGSDDELVPIPSCDTAPAAGGQGLPRDPVRETSFPSPVLALVGALAVARLLRGPERS